MKEKERVKGAGRERKRESKTETAVYRSTG